MEKRGIDISSHQGIIDFNVVKGEVDFVMIRSSYGFFHEDLMFRVNASGCEQNGIPYGFYHYSYAVNLEEAKREVDGMIALIADYKPTYPIVIDMEDSDGYKERNGNPSNKMYVNICELFCSELEKAGYYAMIYANLYWFKNKLNSSKLDRFDKWLAQWGSKPTYDKKFGMWQYSSTGTVAGVMGNVDEDVSYIDYPSVIKEKGLNQLEGERGEVEEEKEMEYIVKKGDTLWKIAKTFYGRGWDYTKIVKENKLKNGNKIYPGQVLRIPNIGKITYKVKKGDTLIGIANKYQIPYQTLYEQNKGIIGNNPDLIQVGIVLQIK